MPTIKEFISHVGPKIDTQGVEPPIMPEGSVAATGYYFSHRRYGEQRAMPTFSEAMEAVNIAEKSLERYEPFVLDYTHFDMALSENICCMSLGRGCSEFEQTGFLGFPNSVFWCEQAENMVYERMKKYVDKVDRSKLKLDVPKNTNLCWPVLNAFAGIANTAFIWAFWMLAEAVIRQKVTMQEVMMKLKGYFGMPFIALGYRLQPSGKELTQALKRGGYVKSKNVYPRVRAIWLGIKFLLMIVRFAVKLIVKAATIHENHCPLQPELTKFFNKYDAKGWIIGMVDASKFDKRHGDNIMRGITKLISRLGGVEQEYLLAEMNLPCTFFYSGQWYFNEQISQLWSGIGSTTVVGILTIDLYIAEVEVRTGFRLGVDFDYRSWGDDQVYYFKDQETKTKFYETLTDLGLVFDEEPYRKFLGHYYYSQYDNIPFVPYATLVSKALDPERKKIDPNIKTISLVARFEKMRAKDQVRFKKALSRYWDEEIWGPKFDWSDKDKVLLNAVQKASGIDLRVVTQMLYSGLDIDEVIMMDDGSPFSNALIEKYANIVEDAHMVGEITGMMSLAESDKIKFLQTEGPMIRDSYRRAAEYGDVDILILLSRRFNGKWEPGGPIF